MSKQESILYLIGASGFFRPFVKCASEEMRCINDDVHRAYSSTDALL